MSSFDCSINAYRLYHAVMMRQRWEIFQSRCRWGADLGSLKCSRQPFRHFGAQHNSAVNGQHHSKWMCFLHIFSPQLYADWGSGDVFWAIIPFWSFREGKNSTQWKSIMARKKKTKKQKMFPSCSCCIIQVSEASNLSWYVGEVGHSRLPLGGILTLCRMDSKMHPTSTLRRVAKFLFWVDYPFKMQMNK